VRWLGRGCRLLGRPRRPDRDDRREAARLHPALPRQNRLGDLQCELRDPATGYAAYIDIESAINDTIVLGVVKNVDGFQGTGG